MLFDLQGRRRRVVQVTYVGLAVLMGGGLVLSGIGSDASGGLLDAFIGGDNGGNDDAKKPFNNQIKAAEAKLRTNPKDRAALAILVRARFGLAGLEQQENDDGSVALSAKGQEEMAKAEQAWGRYVAVDPSRIDSSLAATGLAIYNAVPLPTEQQAKIDRLVRPAQTIAQQENSVDAYIRLVSVATRAGDTRTAGLAERKALSLTATKDERANTKERIETEKAAAAQQSSGAGGAGAAPPAGSP